jgi:hypothetical protein
VTDHDEVVQIERVDELGEVAGMGVHAVAVPRLRRAAVPAAVVGDGAVAVVGEEVEPGSLGNRWRESGETDVAAEGAAATVRHQSGW